jgi:hypothetical protein
MRLVQALSMALLAYAGSAMAYQFMSELRHGRDAWNRLRMPMIVGAVLASGAFIYTFGLNGTVENPIDIAIAALSVGLLAGYVRA